MLAEALPAEIPVGTPRVTEVLRDAGLVDVAWFTEEARDRGTAVHLAARYLEEGDLDRDSLQDASARARLAQYERFLLEVRPSVLAIEEHVYHPIYRYQGTLDRRVKINGREGVLDLKGTCESCWHGIQLAAYAKTFSGPMARWNLYLFDDTYRLVERRDRLDWDVFAAALTLSRWRRTHV